MTQVVDGVTLSDYTVAVIDWLQVCLDAHEAGESIPTDPFYVSTKGVLSDESVDALIAALDEEFNKEMDGYPTYHFRRSGATDRTDWFRLSSPNRRALVEGLQRLVEAHWPATVSIDYSEFC